MIRGVTKPYPGAFSYIEDSKIIIWKANINNFEEKNKESTPGTILINEDQVNVKTGDGFIKLYEIQINDKDYTDLKSLNLFQNNNVFNSK